MPVFFPRSAFIILLFALMAQADAREFDEKAITHVDFPEWFSKSPFMDLAEELDNSRSDNKQGLMVLFTTEGCSYCTAFIEQALGDETIAARVQQQLVSIGMEIFDDAEMVDPSGSDTLIKVFAAQQGVQFSPTLLFFDNECCSMI